MEWHVDMGLATLVAQMKKKHPGMVIGTIAGGGHTTVNTPHMPEADGSVDAADFMIGPHFTKADADEFVAALTAHKDHRISNIIWYRRIISSVVQPWVWRGYTRDDPHTNHVHLEVNDKHETDKSQWNLTNGESDMADVSEDVWGHNIGANGTKSAGGAMKMTSDRMGSLYNDRWPSLMDKIADLQTQMETLTTLVQQHVNEHGV